MCDKLIECSLDSPRTSKAECEESCTTQLELYETWEDKDKLDAFDAERECIGSSTCDEIRDGVCYDDTVFVF
jgi:hypothetical protein